MKVKTYGIYSLTEWHGKVKAGTIEVNVSFVGGTASPSGSQPAYMVTKDPITQFVIENSKEFKDGFIVLVMCEEIGGNHRRMAVPKPVVEKPKTDDAPTTADIEDGTIYVFAHPMTLTAGSVKTTVDAGDAFKYNATADDAKKWVRFYGPVSAE